MVSKQVSTEITWLGQSESCIVGEQIEQHTLIVKVLPQQITELGDSQFFKSICILAAFEFLQAYQKKGSPKQSSYVDLTEN